LRLIEAQQFGEQVGQHIELPGVIRQIGGDAVRDDGTQQGAFGDHADMARIRDGL
jgi:hypothetical protein